MRPLRPGDPTSVEGYKITGYLGEGGQGSVYAGASADGEPVAIKLLHARFSEDPGALRRFQREADAARRVAEFCTARVLDVGAYGDRPYLVSEFIEGPSLQHHVQTAGPLRGPALVRLAVSTATALAAIHRAGVVHRDFKPSNVLLGPDGPRVIDFGIARALDVSQSVTSSIIGTPAYMAPEQFHGEAYPASDVFAWAGTIVFAATGRGGAFGTGPFPALMHRILALPPDLTGVPGELLQVLGASLDKQPQARPSAENVLSTLLTRTAPPPPPPPPPCLQYPSRPYPVSTPPPYPLQPTEPRWSRGREAAVATSAGAAALALVVGTVVWFVNRPPGGTVTPEPTPAALDTRRGGTMRIAMTTSA
ncbi:MAG: serine/threonine protein kinase, partial [Nonomuraea sp.]|nr:serine/threonine protein kinase [Nonomuraea sp.]